MSIIQKGNVHPTKEGKGIKMPSVPNPYIKTEGKNKASSSKKPGVKNG